MARTIQQGSEVMLRRTTLEVELASEEEVEKLREFCRRAGRPMLSEPHTRLRVMEYTNALNRRSR